jgi:hypothetical protein
MKLFRGVILNLPLGLATWAAIGFTLWLIWPRAAHSQNVYQAFGFQQYPSLASATPLTIPTGGPRWALICAETAGVRYRDDGVAPTGSTGQPIAAGQCIAYSGPMGAVQFIQQSSGAVLDVSYYR